MLDASEDFVHLLCPEIGLHEFDRVFFSEGLDGASEPLGGHLGLFKDVEGMGENTSESAESVRFLRCEPPLVSAPGARGSGDPDRTREPFNADAGALNGGFQCFVGQAFANELHQVVR